MEVIRGHLSCPLYGGCPLFGGSAIGGSTVIVLYFFIIVCTPVPIVFASVFTLVHWFCGILL